MKNKTILFKIDNGNHLDSLVSTKNLHGKFCDKPFNTLSIRDDGSCWMCCTSWLPYSIGNLNDNTFEEIWHGDAANLIRASILDGSFKFCSHTTCGDISDDRLPDITEKIVLPDFPTHIMFENDSSCNLSCPSCRTEKIYDHEGPDYDRKLELHNKIIEAVFSRPHDQSIVLDMTGSGDPFGSKIFREFLINFDPTPWPNLILDLHTNGVMFTPTYWHKLEKWHSKIRAIRISFDAASEETYSVTRRGGDWNTLLKNCDYINNELNHNPNIFVLTQFVVQDLNYKEMKDYVQLVLDRFPNFYYIEFQLVIDWGTWNTETYNKRAIWMKDHPEHKQFLEVLSDPIFKNPKVRLGNVANILAFENR